MNDEKCPHCGSQENVAGIQGVEAYVSSTRKLSVKREQLHYIICLKCGTVIRSFVQKPERLK